MPVQPQPQFQFSVALPVLMIGGVMTVLALIALVRSLRQRQLPPERTDPVTYGFPVVSDADAPRQVEEIGTGPGRYRVVGVVRETGTDTTMYVEAITPANAKVKAELKGVIVTEVEKA